jgi:hypothetical protein
LLLRNFTLFILTILFAAPAYSQRICGTETAALQQIAQNPALQQVRDQYEARMKTAIARMKLQKMNAKVTYDVVTVPVVFHIVLKNPNSVTDAQIAAQIVTLNQDYIAANTDIGNVPNAWKPLIGNSGLQFTMAQRTPDGNPTNGIDRVVTTKTNFSVDNAAHNVKFASSGGADIWDPTRYLNVWVCDLESTYLGISTIPGLYPASEEGVVIDYTGFGTGGTAVAPYNKGRTAVHEIGHYFSLRHTWGDEPNCAVDDGIDDTPLQGTYTYGCPAFPVVDKCSVDSPGIMFNNYMDYADDACMLLFTSDQVDRMRTSLNNDHPGILTSDAAVPVNLLNYDAQLNTLVSPVGQVCDNSITPVVVLKNQGLQTLTSVTIGYQLDDGSVQSYQWTGSLAALKTDTVKLPAGAMATGAHLLSAFSSAPNGQTDQDLSNDTVTNAVSYYPDASFPFTEGFEGGTFPPDGWEIKNYDQSYTWELTTDAAKSGTHSIVMHNLDYATNAQNDDIFTPLFNPSGVDSVFLFFDVAAASYSPVTSNAAPWDSLQVLTTSDCGLTFDLLYDKGDPALVTRKQNVTSEFVPLATEWRRDSVNLTPILKKGRFRVVFRNVSNDENNIYLDNINLVTKTTDPYLKDKGLTIGPVPVTNQLFITFLNPPDNLQYIALYNTIGQQVAKQPGSAINGSNRFIFDLVNEPNGIYFVKLIYTSSVKTIKITKVN